METSTKSASRLQAIAEKTGVPPQRIIDIILNNQVLIPDATYRAIINALVDGGNWTFDCVVFRSDKTQRTPARLLNDYIDNLTKGMNKAILGSSYRISYHVGNRDVMTPDLYEALLQKYSPCGLISITTDNPDLISEVCQKYQVPCIFVDYQGKHIFRSEYVMNVSNRRSIKVAMQHLFDLGHRRIGFITGKLSMTSAVERLNGYREALAQAGIEEDPALIVEGNWSPEHARSLTQQLLNQADRPTAIMASNDAMASGAIIAIREYGLRVPKDISVVGFDDIPMAEDLALTTVRQPIDLMGTEAIHLMTALLDQQAVSQHEYEYPADLILRETTRQLY